MEIVGGGSVVELGPEHEGPHEKDNHTFWQESVVNIWWDSNNQIGGFHRIGHEPNREEGPKIALSNHLWSPEWIYKDTRDIPMQEKDQFPNGFGAGETCLFEFKDMQALWTVRDKDNGVSAYLVLSDNHVPINIYPSSGAISEVAPNHMEVSSIITGSMEIKSKHYDVQGQAFRDHGWGVRHWDSYASHRWIAGSFGPGMTIFVVTFLDTDNNLSKFGALIRDNKLAYATDIDVVTYMEVEGTSHRGGHVTMTLTTGEVLEIECRMLTKGVISWINGISCVDVMCEMTCGNRKGICCFEMSNNPMHGHFRPKFAINAIEKNGLHKIG
ncbi:MAG: hypothetical protein OXC05_06990 [Halieaceae bacterium]|nr:hypothetical protein [Halieaceae bacterium]